VGSRSGPAIPPPYDTAMKERQRCSWANGDDPLMARYHDEEWGVPQRDARMLWEMLMLEGFQAGLSWRTILHKREAFRKAFAGFDPRKVARFDEKKIEKLLQDEGIIRSRSKIEATIAGAKIYCDMEKQGEDFADFCWSFTGGKVIRGDGRSLPVSTPKSEEISKALKKRGFKFVGPVIVYAWMQAVGMVDDHALGCFNRR
jgi:DNA-3-methyladenine glycosylase I